ncbi:MAG: hydrogenase maturation peptidase HycI [Candidatus Saganbacteria bacterium]|nr:hydrogenase maturation peptidase HycI [Candidatus Saganbacteria bacterium]
MNPALIRLKKSLVKAARAVLVGVGSELRGDDRAGLLVAEKIKNKKSKIKILAGGTAPENLTGEIKRLKPSHLIIVDSADFGAAPGTVEVIDYGRIGGHSFSTHSAPLKLMVDFLLADISFEPIIIGIQPKSLEFGAAVSPEVEAAVDEVVAALIR